MDDRQNGVPVLLLKRAAQILRGNPKACHRGLISSHFQYRKHLA
jgi:hypothetical protein